MLWPSSSALIALVFSFCLQFDIAHELGIECGDYFIAGIRCQNAAGIHGPLKERTVAHKI